MTQKTFKVDGDFLNPFIAAAKMTLETQASTELTPQKAYIKKPGEGSQVIKTEIAGIINLTCEQFSGSVALCFPSEVFFKIYERMLDEKVEKINEEVSDCAGELLNIIFGTAKTALMAKGYKLERAIPTVLAGKDLQVQFKSKFPAIVLPFDSTAGPFHIEVLVDPEG